MPEKFLQLDTVDGSIRESRSVDTTTGVEDAGKIPALDAAGRLDQSLMPVGLIPGTRILTASEDLAAGDFVTIWNDIGIVKVKKGSGEVDDTTVIGFVLDDVVTSVNDQVLVYFEGTNTQCSGTIAGTRYFIGDDTNRGVPVAVPPSSNGNVIQYLGTAISETEIIFEPSDGIVVAA